MFQYRLGDVLVNNINVLGFLVTKNEEVIHDKIVGLYMYPSDS